MSFLNRHARRAAAVQSVKLAHGRPDNLTAVPAERWPPQRTATPGTDRLGVFESKQYLVQVFSEPNVSVGSETFELFRITVCRVVLNKNGRFQDDIAWSELQAIKNEIGFGNHYAVEIYPRGVDLVDVANMRHLWVIDRPLPIGWFASVGPR
jgi:hypothetical protein